MVSGNARDPLESIRCYKSQNIVDFLVDGFRGGILRRRALRTDRMDLDRDNSGRLREFKERLILPRIFVQVLC